MRGLQSQHGIALITVMLIVAISVTLMVSLASKHQRDIRRIANFMDREQAYLYVVSAENWATNALARDRSRNTHDSYKDVWAAEIPLTELEEGEVEAKLIDQQGLFNINNLAFPEEGHGDGTSLTLPAIFSSQGIPIQVQEAILDWLDNDRRARVNGGAEDDYYLSLDPPYRARNGPIGHISELRLIRGVSEEIYQKLIRFLSVLPEKTSINMNTVPLELLWSLDRKIPLSTLDNFEIQRRSDPFTKESEFGTRMQGLSDDIIGKADFGVVSNWFILQTRVRFGRSQIRMNSLIHRVDGNNIHVVGRTQVLE